jgi:hypothetical protein
MGRYPLIFRPLNLWFEDKFMGRPSITYESVPINISAEDKYMGRPINYGSTDNLWVGAKFMGRPINYGPAIKLFIGR